MCSPSNFKKNDGFIIQCVYSRNLTLIIGSEICTIFDVHIHAADHRCAACLRMINVTFFSWNWFRGSLQNCNAFCLYCRSEPFYTELIMTCTGGPITMATDVQGAKQSAIIHVLSTMAVVSHICAIYITHHNQWTKDGNPLTVPGQLETHGFVLSTVATDALVL